MADVLALQVGDGHRLEVAVDVLGQLARDQGLAGARRAPQQHALGQWRLAGGETVHQLDHLLQGVIGDGHVLPAGFQLGQGLEPGVDPDQALLLALQWFGRLEQGIQRAGMGGQAGHGVGSHLAGDRGQAVADRADLDAIGRMAIERQPDQRDRVLAGIVGEADEHRLGVVAGFGQVPAQDRIGRVWGGHAHGRVGVLAAIGMLLAERQCLQCEAGKLIQCLQLGLGGLFGQPLAAEPDHPRIQGNGDPQPTVEPEQGIDQQERFACQDPQQGPGSNPDHAHQHQQRGDDAQPQAVVAVGQPTQRQGAEPGTLGGLGQYLLPRLRQRGIPRHAHRGNGLAGLFVGLFNGDLRFLHGLFAPGFLHFQRNALLFDETGAGAVRSHENDPLKKMGRIAANRPGNYKWRGCFQ